MCENFVSTVIMKKQFLILDFADQDENDSIYKTYGDLDSTSFRVVASEGGYTVAEV